MAPGAVEPCAEGAELAARLARPAPPAASQPRPTPIPAASGPAARQTARHHAGNRLGQFANDAANGLELIRHRPDGASVIFTRLGIDRTHAVLEIDQPPCDDGHPVFDSDEPIRKFSRRSGDPGRIGDDRPRDVPFSASPATGQNEDDGPKSDHCCAGDELEDRPRARS